MKWYCWQNSHWAHERYWRMYSHLHSFVNQEASISNDPLNPMKRHWWKTVKINRVFFSVITELKEHLWCKRKHFPRVIFIVLLTWETHECFVVGWNPFETLAKKLMSLSTCFYLLRQSLAIGRKFHGQDYISRCGKSDGFGNSLGAGRLPYIAKNNK